MTAARPAEIARYQRELWIWLALGGLSLALWTTYAVIFRMWIGVLLLVALWEAILRGVSLEPTHDWLTQYRRRAR